MNIPQKIKVGSVIYDVVMKSFIEIGGNRNYQGCCSCENTEISLLGDLSKERKESTFVHELTHAIFYEAGFEEQDEDMINRVAKVLHQVIEDNDFKRRLIETKEGFVEAPENFNELWRNSVIRKP